MAELTAAKNKRKGYLTAVTIMASWPIPGDVPVLKRLQEAAPCGGECGGFGVLLEDGSLREAVQIQLLYCSTEWSWEEGKTNCAGVAASAPCHAVKEEEVGGEGGHCLRYHQVVCCLEALRDPGNKDPTNEILVPGQTGLCWRRAGRQEGAGYQTVKGQFCPRLRQPKLPACHWEGPSAGC